MGGKGYQTLSKALSCDSMEAVTIGGGGSSTRNKNIAQGTRNVNMDAAIESDMKQCGGGGGGFTGGDAANLPDVAANMHAYRTIKSQI